MTVADTSIEAYHEHRDSGRLGAQHLHILDQMRPGWGYSRRELMLITGLELSSICGRVNELVKLGMLQEQSPRKCGITGRRVVPVIKPGLF
jgi:hypothetical protein